MTKEMKKPTSNIEQSSIKPALSQAVAFYTNNNKQAHKCIQERDEYIDYLESEVTKYREAAIYECKLRCDEKSQLQQQALPVVPECVGEFVSGDETKLSKADRIAYLIKSVQGDSYYLTVELPGDGTITVDEGQDLYNWAICQHHETILKLWNGYTVEKPQLFYLKNMLTGDCLAICLARASSGLYVEVTEKWLTRKEQTSYKLYFTQSEIDSMQTGSYEQIEVK